MSDLAPATSHEAAVEPARATEVPDGTTISCASLSRWFGLVVAVSDVSFELRPGVTALVGPNGAGKSTLMRLLTGLLSPSRGSVRVLGEDPRSSREVRRQIGLVPQYDALFNNLSALEMVTVIAKLHGTAKPHAAATAALDRVELSAKLKRAVSTYSTGMRERVRIACAIVHSPKVLLADEPLRGLDPLQRRHTIGLLRELGADGVTVLVSSHVLDELERIGSNVVVIAAGRVAATGDYRALRRLMANKPYQTSITTDRPRELAAGLMAINGVLGVSLVDDKVAVDISDPETFGRELAPAAVRAEAKLRAVEPTDEGLEEVFGYIVGGRQ